jgi:error-prone DNA polymerase
VVRRNVALPDYAELCCSSNFSFLNGASQPEELVARAQALGYSALAITDECSLAGVVRAHAAAQSLQFRVIVGAQMRLSLASGAAPARQVPGTFPPITSAAEPHLVVLAQSRRGYGNLSQWITVARRRAPKGEYQAYRTDLEGKVPTAPTLAGLPDCTALLWVHPGQPFDTVFNHALWLKTWFGLERAGLAVVLQHGPHDALLVDVLVRVSTLTGLPLVACGGVRMHVRSRKPLLDALVATRLRCTVAQAGHALQGNAEAHLRSRVRLGHLYQPAWLAATLQVAARCAFSLNELRYEYPREIVPAGHTATSWLRHLTEEGACQRYGGSAQAAGADPLPFAVRQMVEHELALIAQLRYEPYFLTVADLVHWARGQGILCQGRGSAANSAVCYCLGITAVDPARSTLLFERFISAERNEPPDIDIDFEHQRREEVIQYVYRKYGRHRAALTGVVISYRPRSALRDMGRALGIDLERIEAVAKSQHRWIADSRSAPAPAVETGGDSEVAGVSVSEAEEEGDAGAPALARPGVSNSRSSKSRTAVDPERLRENGFDPDSRLCQLWMQLTETLIGFPRHLSQHPGGFVIARDDLAQLVPVENAAMEGRSVIQWDKDDLDTLGLLKVDLLALGMLSAIRRALVMVGHKLALPGGALPLHQVPPECPATYAMLCRGDSVGTFQVESRAQMSMLPRLKPQQFYDLVIEVAIVRPGPIQGGMVHPYLRRRNGEEPVDYPSSEVRQALQRTLGVPIFQEQVMQLAILAADFTPGEADQLRRAMAAWKRKGGLGPFHERLVGRMCAKGYTREYAERIFQQIEGFGEYGFPESHAASFALLVYVSAWLKCHHPDAFLAALLNSQPMGFYAPAQLVRDAREHGVQVLPVCVHASEVETVLQPAAAPAPQHPGQRPRPEQTVRMRYPVPPGLQPVRLGLNRIGGLPLEAMQRIVAARQAGGPFSNAEDLARRAQLDAHALALLAQANALQSLAGHRHQAAWAVAGIDTRATPLLKATRTHEAPVALDAPSAAHTVLADYRATGLSLVQHPLALLRQQLAAFKVQPADVLRGYPNGRLARASGLVTHRQRPGTAKGVVFVTLEDDTGSVNVIVWPAVAEAQRRPLLAATLLTVYGVWQCEGEVRHLVARQLVDHSGLLHGLQTNSRDFR